MRGTVGNLFSLCKDICGVSIKSHLSDNLQWAQFFRDDFGGIQEIEIELVLIVFLQDLQSQFPFGIGSTFDCFEEISSVEIWIDTVENHSLGPSHGMSAQLRNPMEFNESGAYPE